MKRKAILIFGVFFYFITAIFAQINVVITPKTSIFPNNSLSYIETPWKYFNVTLTNTSSQTMDIYLTMSLACQFTGTGQNLGFETPSKKVPHEAIQLAPGGMVVLTQRHLSLMFDHLTRQDVFPPDINIYDFLQLPEGQYTICITPYQWVNFANNPSPIEVGQKGCFSFNICYSGSAPEFVTPIVGQSAANLNAPTFQNAGNSNNSSDNRHQSGFATITPTQQLTFRWTGVISNCLSSNNFNYMLKIVEIFPGQNIQDAIQRNATLATINNKTSLFYTHDTLKNRQFRLERGHAYAAQVQAIPKSNSLDEIGIQLANEGKSQIIAFVWGESNQIFGNTEESSTSTPNNITSKETDNREDILKTICNPYLVLPARDEQTIAELIERIPSEQANISSLGEEIPFEETENARIYKLPKSDSLQIKWINVYSDSITAIDYNLNLYRYIGGAPAISVNSHAPIKSKKISIPANKIQELIQNHSTPYSFDENWSNELVEGEQYVLALTTEFIYKHKKTITYTTTEYINGIPITEDSVVVRYFMDHAQASSAIVFQWGIDSSALIRINPAEFVYPSKTFANSDEWNEIPSCFKDDDFKFTWSKPKGVSYLGISAQDSVVYDVCIHELKDRQTIEQALTDTLYYVENLTKRILESEEFLDTLKTDKNYVAWIRTRVIINPDKYLFENNGISKYAVFHLKPELEYDLTTFDPNRVCFPNALDSTKRTPITPKADSLINNKVRIMLGEFPLVMQTGKLDTEKKSYSGEGYIIWKLYGVDCFIKVKYDSIVINKDYQVIKGTAKNLNKDSLNYVQFDLGFGATDWIDDKVNKLVQELGTNEQVKEYYDYVNKYTAYTRTIIGNIYERVAQTPVFTLPIAIDDSKINNAANVKVSINEMYFSPTTSLMNIVAIFNSNSDNLYIPLVATNVCMKHGGFLEGVGNSIDLYLAKNYEFDLTDGYKFRFKAGEKMGDTTNATFLSLDNNGFRKLSVIGEIDFGSSLKKADMTKNGTVIPNKPVQARLTTTIESSWKDWVATAYMDPFAISGIEDYTFIPTGKGIVIDHSNKSTPNIVKFPKGYNKSQNKEWQGFYLDQFLVLLPDDISNTFTDDDDQPNKDSVLVYNYGLNNTQVDSTHYFLDGSRIKVGAQNLIWDKAGISVDLIATDILSAKTDRGGSWAFSIDTILLRFITNEFKFGSIEGKLGAPLLTGSIKYKCAIGLDSLEFSLKPGDKDFGLDLWAAKLVLNQNSSYFSLNKKYNQDLKIDLVLNGQINIDLRKFDIPAELPGIKFENMIMRNFSIDSSNTNKLVYNFDGFHFDAGEWSKASPQKKMFVYNTDLYNSNENKPIASTSIGGFNMSLNSIKPIFQPKDENNYYTAGLNMAGEISIGVGSSSTGKIGGGIGFEFYSKVRFEDDFDIKDFDGHVDSIMIDTDLDVFKLKGLLAFFREDAQYGEGLRGVLDVSILNGKVDLKMAGGFGSITNESKNYDWWFLEGAANCKPGIPLGVISLTGLGGGFAYNMELSKESKNADPSKLRKFTDGIVSTGLAFVPKRDAWVAKAGIALALAEPNTMNADGYMSLRVANGHFSGFMLQVNANVITNFNESTEKNSNTVLKVGATIAIENTKDHFEFKFDASVNSEINLLSLLKDVASSVVPSETLWPESGVLSKETSPTKNKEAKAPSGNIKIQIPIALHVKHYKKGVSPNTNTENEWYFSIGKPERGKRVEFSIDADLVVCSAKSTFTFYFMTGNYFPGGFTLPPLDETVEKFLRQTDKGDKVAEAQAAREKVNSTQNAMIFEKAGGFAMGASFAAEVKFDFFLYVEVSAALGFDVALLNTNGQSCEGYNPIGKNNFYALGQVYGMLEGKIGLSLNLGFWKGKVILLEAGMGALLQGGGPKPTWAYGLLRFKASMLGGLVKINTSVDFKLGNVCIPETPNPLINVKLFEEITPAYNTMEEATKGMITPFTPITINSNMPWNEDVVLCTKTDANGNPLDARRFKFILCAQDASFKVPNTPTGWKQSSLTTDQIIIDKDQQEPNILHITNSEGAFEGGQEFQVSLSARALEYRNHIGEKETDYSYTLSPSNGQSFSLTRNVCTDASTLWRDPLWIEDGKQTIQQFKVDTTFYLHTKPRPNNLEDQVLLTWPYNGEAFLPSNGLVNENEIYIFVNNDRSDLFVEKELEQKVLKLITLYTRLNKVNNQIEEIITEIDQSDVHYSYDSYKNQIGKIRVKIPKDKYYPSNSNNFESNNSIIHKVEFLLVDLNQYNTAMNNAFFEEQTKLQEIYETQGRDLLNIMGQTTTSFSSTSNNNSNQNNQGSTPTLEPIKQRGERMQVISDTQTDNSGGLLNNQEFVTTIQQAGIGFLLPDNSGSSNNQGGAANGTIQLENQIDPSLDDVQLSKVEKQLGLAKPKVRTRNTRGKTNPRNIGQKTAQLSIPKVINLTNPISGTQPTLVNNNKIDETYLNVKANKIKIADANVIKIDREIANNANNNNVNRDRWGNIKFDRVDPADVNIPPTDNTSTNDNINIRQTIIQTARNEYYTQGADTMNSFTRKKLLSIQLAKDLGTPVYTLRFRSGSVKGETMHKNYQAIFDNIKTRIKFDTTKITAEKVNWRVLHYAYLFAPYKPNNTKQYASNVILPPIANFNINTTKSASYNSLIRAYIAYQKEIKDFYNSSQQLYKFSEYPHQKNDRHCRFTGWERTTINMSSLQSRYIKWTRNPNSTFNYTQYRLKDSYENITNPSDISTWWKPSTLINIKNITQDSVTRIKEDEYASFAANKNTSSFDIGTETIEEIENDLISFRNFFQNIYNLGKSFNQWGFSDCKGNKSTSTAAKKEARLNYAIAHPNNYLTIDNCPVQIPELTRVLHYFYAWEFSYRIQYIYKNKPKTKVPYHMSIPQYNLTFSLGFKTYSFAGFKNEQWSRTQFNDGKASFTDCKARQFMQLWYKYWIRTNYAYIYKTNQGIERYPTDFNQVFDFPSRSGKTEHLEVSILYFDPLNYNAVATLEKAAANIKKNITSNNYRILMANKTYENSILWKVYTTKKNLNYIQK